MKMLTTKQPDGSVWGVPVELIARDRAKHYAHEFGGDIERSLREDTWPCFADEFEIADWAQNNMNWSDVQSSAKCITSAPEPDFQEGWMNGDKHIIDA